MLRFVFATLIACLLAGLTAAPAPAEDEPAWKYDVIVSLPGTRSEGRTGVLTYGEVTVLPYFTEVVTPVGYFAYKVRMFRWGNAGWVQEERKVLPPTELDEKITAEELERGWYSCEARTIKPGTPEHWFWTPTFNLRIDPAKLNAFVNDHFNKADWSYVLKAGAEGTVVSSLTYKGTPIPQSVQKILTPVGEFHVPSQGAGSTGGPVGWMLFSGEVLDEVPAGDNPLDEATVTKGVFDENVEMTDVAIPDGWVYLPEKRWWLDPAKIGEHFQDAAPIRPIIHGGGKIISKDEKPPEGR